MPIYGNKSSNELSTTERDIQTIFNEVIKYIDCSIIEGKRTAERQAEHWAKGREHIAGNPKERNNWKVVNDTKVVTTKDGYEKLSKHQIGAVSSAVDVTPYPEMWSNNDKFHELAGAIKATQIRLLAEGKIEKTLNWGYDLWGWDRPHWQI